MRKATMATTDTESQRWIEVPDWDKYQHRDALRTPQRIIPWIKSYTALLSKDEYLDLSFHQRGILHGLLIEYAKAQRQLGDSTIRLSKRLGQRVTRRDLEALNDAGFIAFSASRPPARGQQAASLEEEKDKEAEEHEEQEQSRWPSALLERMRREARRASEQRETRSSVQRVNASLER